MKRFLNWLDRHDDALSVAAISLLLIAGPLAALLGFQPARAAEPFSPKAPDAQTEPGHGADIQIGSWRTLQVAVSVTDGAGTVSAFRVWLEGTQDGTTWYELVCSRILKSGAAAPGTSTAIQRDIVNETAVVTSAKYTALCETYFSTVRAAWHIAGTDQSETFSVIAVGK